MNYRRGLSHLWSALYVAAAGMKTFALGKLELAIRAMRLISSVSTFVPRDNKPCGYSPFGGRCGTLPPFIGKKGCVIMDIRQYVHVVEPRNPKEEEIGTLWRRYLHLKGAPGYDHKRHFHASETSQFLESSDLANQMPYGRLLARTPAMQQASLDGVQVGNHWWHTAMAWVGANSLRTIITPESLSYIETLKLLDIKVLIKQGVEVKALGKRLKRITAPHHFGWWGGRVVDIVNRYQGDNDTLVRFILPQHKDVFTHVIRRPGNRWHETTTNGWGWIKTSFINKIQSDHHMQNGDGFQFTLLEPEPANHGKGHMGVRDDIKSDIVTYETKDELAAVGRNFSFGLLNALHPSGLFTNIQPVINLGIHKAHDGRYLQELGTTFHEGLFKRLDSITRMDMDLNKLLRVDKDTGEFIVPEGFILAIAHAAGIDIRHHPALLEKWFRALADSRWNMHPDSFRLPVGENGLYLYMSPEWGIFDAEGIPHEDWSQLKEHEMFAEGRVGEAIAMRSPQGTPNRRAAVKLTFNQRAAQWDRGVFAQVPASSMAGHLDEELENPDLDDPLQFYLDPGVVAWVKSFDSGYPRDYMKDSKPTPIITKFYKRPPLVYSRRWVAVAIAEMARAQVNIGGLVNLAELDIYQTLYRQEMVDGLHKMKLDGIANLMEKYPRFVASGIGNNTGFIIDAINKTGQLLDWVGKFIWGSGNNPDGTKIPDTSLYNTLPAVPELWTYSGKSGSRMPAKLVERRVPVVKTHLDYIHDELVAMHDQAMQDIHVYGWDNAFVPGKEFSGYPSHKQALAIAKEVRSRYITRLGVLKDQFLKTGVDLEGKPVVPKEVIIKAFVAAQRETAQYVAAHPLGMDVWIKLIELVYSSKVAASPKVQPDGTVASFGDGLLWGRDTGVLTVEAFRRLGLTYEWKSIDWMTGQHRHKYRDVAVQVIVSNTLVRQVGTSDHPANYLGTVGIQDGEYAMVAGRIKVPVPEDLSGAGAMVTAFEVVNGWPSNLAHGFVTQVDLNNWFTLIGSRAYIQMTVFKSKAHPEGEPAARVFAEGTDQPIGWVSRAQLPQVSDGMRGQLHGYSKYTMLLIVDKEQSGKRQLLLTA